MKALTVGEVADMLNVSPSHIRRLIANGTLNKVPHTGRSVRIAAGEVDRVFFAVGGAA